MKKPIIIVLFCLACGLCSCTQTDSSRKKSESKTMTTEIDSNYYLQDTIHNPYKKAEGTTEKRDCNTSIWNKSNDNNSNNNNSIPESVIADTKEIMEGIHNNKGLFSSSRKLNKYIERINIDNVALITVEYERTFGKSIFNEIMSNVNISSKTRAEAVKHIKDLLMQRAKSYGVYTDDIDRLIDGHIEYEKNKFGRMKSKDIDQDINTFFRRSIRTTSYPNTLYPANGKIDAGFNQGYVMDCWLLAAIKSLSLNPKGLEMLEDLISIDDKGNVTVKLKGVDSEYTIPKEELEGANEFAQGDLDVRAIEIAVNKYLHEIEDHTTLFGKLRDSYNRGTFIYFDINHGMWDLDITDYILFGKECCGNIRPDEETIEKIQSGTNPTIVASRNSYNLNGYMKNHVYTVIGADDNYVYLSEPYNTNTNLSMTHEEFLKFFNAGHSTKF